MNPACLVVFVHQGSAFTSSEMGAGSHSSPASMGHQALGSSSALTPAIKPTQTLALST